MSRSRISNRVAKYSTVSLGSTLITMACTFIISLWAARILGPEDFGHYSYLLFLIMMCLLGTNLGLTTSVTKYISEYEGKGDKKSSEEIIGFGFRLRMHSVAIIVLILIAGTILYYYFTRDYTMSLAFFVLVIWLLPTVIIRYFTDVIIGRQMYVYLLKANVIFMPITLVLSVVALLLGYGILGLVMVSLIVAVPNAMLISVYARRTGRLGIGNRHISPVAKKRLMTFSYFIIGITFIDAIVWQRSEVLFLEWFRPAAEVGYYAAAYGVSWRIASTAFMVIPMVLMPIVSEVYGRRNHKKLKQIFTDSSKYLILVAVPACGFGVAFSEILIYFFYGGEYAASIFALKVLFISAAFALVASASSSTAYGMERPDFIFKFGLIVAILNITFDFLFIPYHTQFHALYNIVPLYGLNGALFANITAQVTGAVIGIYYVNNVILNKNKYPLDTLVRSVVAAVFCTDIVGALLWKIGVPDGALVKFVVIISSLILYILMYLVTISFSGALTRDDFERLESLAHKLPRGIGVIFSWLVLALASIGPIARKAK